MECLLGIGSVELHSGFLAWICQHTCLNVCVCVNVCVIMCVWGGGGGGGTLVGLRRGLALQRTRAQVSLHTLRLLQAYNFTAKNRAHKHARKLQMYHTYTITNINTHTQPYACHLRARTYTDLSLSDKSIMRASIPPADATVFLFATFTHKFCT